MSLKHGILGFLSQWPNTTGYDLKKEFDTHMSLFWFSHLSQIYPELYKLQKQELIHRKTIKQEGKPDKKIYTITSKGMQELKMWLLQPPEAPKVKDSFLMQTFFMDKVPFDDVVFMLRTYKKEREKRLTLMENIFKKKYQELRTNDSPITARIIMSGAVYKQAIEQERQYIKWCDDTIGWLSDFSMLWEGNQTDSLQLDEPETSGLKEVPSLPFSTLEEKIRSQFGDDNF